MRLLNGKHFSIAIRHSIQSHVPEPPSGALWLHEIKHDGFLRVITRKDGERVKLYNPARQ